MLNWTILAKIFRLLCPLLWYCGSKPESRIQTREKTNKIIKVPTAIWSETKAPTSKSLFSNRSLKTSPIPLGDKNWNSTKMKVAQCKNTWSLEYFSNLIPFLLNEHYWSLQTLSNLIIKVLNPLRWTSAPVGARRCSGESKNEPTTAHTLRHVVRAFSRSKHHI